MKRTIVALIVPLMTAACNESPADSVAGSGGAPAGSGGTAANTGGTPTGGAGGTTGGRSGAANGGVGAAGSGNGGTGTGGSLGGASGTGGDGGGGVAGDGGSGGVTAGSGGALGGMSGMSGAGGGTVDDRDAHFRDFPSGADPATVGRRVAQVFVAETPEDPKHYKVACAWYGSLAVAAVLDDAGMLTSLTTKYDPYENSWASLL